MAILYFVILLSIIVVVHELGHLIAAKCFNVYCGEFSLGMGPKLWSHQFKETQFTIRALPIGGYVAMAGEQGSEFENIPVERTIKGISHWKQIIVLSAGVTMNFVLAWILFSGIIANVGGYNIPPKPIVDGVVENSPAQQAGFLANDVIKKVQFSDGTVVKPKNFYEILTYSQTNSEAVTYTVERNKETLQFTLTPKWDEAEKRFLVGLKVPSATYVETNLLNCGYYGGLYMVDTTKELFTALGRLVQGIGLDQLSGPVGIYQVTQQQVNLGLTNYLLLIALLSLNVGVFNLLPLPILDGGRIILTFIEMIMGRPLNKKLETIIMSVGVALIFVIMIFATWQDISRLF